MGSWKLADGIWQEASSIDLNDRGFRYGMSVFETVAVVDSRPLLLNDHLARLARAASDCEARLPAMPRFDFTQTSTGLLRFYLTFGSGKPTEPFDGQLFAIFEPTEVTSKLADARVRTCSAPYLPRPGGWKTGNYWQNIDALATAQQSDCDEALLFNPAGMLVSASMANVFLQIGENWLTPTLATGARDGAVRSWALAHTGAEETVIESEQLQLAKACFLTNSRYGVRSVAELDGRPLENLVVPLQQRYRNEIFDV
jgi:branched-subunit amino acid aminotransferase/4-amino-4-deoxychorismate lyase